MRIPGWLSASLACPRCGVPLGNGLAAGRCPGCLLAFPSPAATSIDLRGDRDPDSGWCARQQHMEREYDTLLDDGDHAARAFENDYRTIAGILRECTGRILDVGGGIGVTREWLPADDDYVLLEPSDLWRDRRWLAWSGRFPSLTRPVVHVRAFGEALPFSSGTFDVVLHLWTLNHMADPTTAVREALRVLRVGGRLVAVLEEARPGWRDVTAASGDSVIGRARAAAQRFAAMARPLELQPDHIAVNETLLTRAAGARLVSRRWTGPYLTVVLESR